MLAIDQDDAEQIRRKLQGINNMLHVDPVRVRPRLLSETTDAKRPGKFDRYLHSSILKSGKSINFR